MHPLTLFKRRYSIPMFSNFIFFFTNIHSLSPVLLVLLKGSGGGRGCAILWDWFNIFVWNDPRRWLLCPKWAQNIILLPANVSNGGRSKRTSNDPINKSRGWQTSLRPCFPCEVNADDLLLFSSAKELKVRTSIFPYIWYICLCLTSLNERCVNRW